MSVLQPISVVAAALFEPGIELVTHGMVDRVGGPSKVSARMDITGGETVALSSRRVLTAFERMRECSRGIQRRDAPPLRAFLLLTTRPSMVKTFHIHYYWLAVVAGQRLHASLTGYTSVCCS